MSARVILPTALCGLLRSELERTICESAFSKDDSLIAHRYLVEKVAQIDIAVELGWERATVSRHLKYILPAVEQAAHKLYAQ